MSVTLEKIDEILEQYEEWQNEADCQLVKAMTEKIELPPKPSFEVTDKSSAEWVLRKIQKLNMEIQENSNIANEQTEPLKQEIQKIMDWELVEHQKINNRIEFLKSLLYPYHRMILEADPKAKTIKLPHGELKIRAQQPEYQKDDDVMVNSLKALELKDYVKTKETPDWAKLKPLTTVVNGNVVHVETGAIIEGITAIERPDKFEVTTS